MDNFFVLMIIGFAIGTFGTLIGAGGGFLLVPMLLLTHPHMPAEITTAISIAIVAANAVSGSIAYAKSKLIDYRAGLLFAAFTIPGSVIGVYLTSYIPKHSFNLIFGILLVVLSVYLFIKNKKNISPVIPKLQTGPGWKSHEITDRSGNLYHYQYNERYGILVSIIVGFLSPLLGIGGGIIHVPAMVQWLQFPVYVATATSHFILAIMSSISVVVHVVKGHYNDSNVLKMVAGLCIGVIPGAQLGAFLSHKLKTTVIIRLLAVCLALVGVRILLNAW